MKNLSLKDVTKIKEVATLDIFFHRFRRLAIETFKFDDTWVKQKKFFKNVNI